jgi:hypothetical protein
MTNSKSKSKRRIKFHVESWDSNEFFEYQENLRKQAETNPNVKYKNFCFKLLMGGSRESPRERQTFPPIRKSVVFFGKKGNK